MSVSVPLKYRRFLVACSLLLAVGCSSYRQNLLFRPTTTHPGNAPLESHTDRNYVIAVNDQLKLDVFSNNGERIIDPNGELVRENNGIQQGQTARPQPSYLVAIDGSVKFPLIDGINLAGMTIREAEVKLQTEYNKFYKECYVLLSFVNKRVVVLGSPGGQVIPLVNENVTVVEVLALAKGIGNDGKAHNIRLIRGDQTFVLDLSSLDGLAKNNMVVQPGDVIYVEPIRRPFAEGARDLAPVLSLVLSLATLIVVFISNN